MNKYNTKAMGYRFPAEWESHRANGSRFKKILKRETGWKRFIHRISNLSK
jgi:hypothetical protein